MSFHPVPNVTDDDIRQMAREAEVENLLLPPLNRKPLGWHYRRASILLGTMPLPEMTLEEVTWRLAYAMINSQESGG